MNLCLSVNSDTKYLWKSFLIYGCFLLDIFSKCYNTPIKADIPYDLRRPNALYPASSIAFEYLSGSVLSPFMSLSAQDITTTNRSAIFPISNTYYGSSLFISKKINLCFLLPRFVELPGLGQTYALNYVSCSKVISSVSFPLPKVF